MVLHRACVREVEMEKEVEVEQEAQEDQEWELQRQVEMEEQGQVEREAQEDQEGELQRKAQWEVVRLRLVVLDPVVERMSRPVRPQALQVASTAVVFLALPDPFVNDL